MVKTRNERILELIYTIQKLDEILDEATIKDELVGDTIILDRKKMDLFMNNLKMKTLDAFYEEQYKKDMKWKPVRDALKLIVTL
jgi:hypothetical protein